MANHRKTPIIFRRTEMEESGKAMLQGVFVRVRRGASVCLFVCLSVCVCVCVESISQARSKVNGSFKTLSTLVGPNRFRFIFPVLYFQKFLEVTSSQNRRTIVRMVPLPNMQSQNNVQMTISIISSSPQDESVHA